MKCAGSAVAARPADQRTGGGAIPTPALQSLRVAPIPFTTARAFVKAHHYLGTMPGGSRLSFGVFVDARLAGALVLGCGPSQVHRLVRGAAPDDGLTLTRLCLADDLPKNAESRVIGVVLRALRHDTAVKFVVSYADPAQGHLGTIYMASGWTYTGTSQAMPILDLGDGVLRHSRSFAHAFGTHSGKHFAAHGVTLRFVPQAPKHRYVYFLDPTWRSRLLAPVLPYPKREVIHGPH